MREGGIDVDSLRFHSRAPYSLEANWKVAVENFLECYHCAVAHPGFSEVVDVSPDSYRLEHTRPSPATTCGCATATAAAGSST